MSEEPKPINAKTFQEPLWKLAETVAQKVRREGTPIMGTPAFVADDLFMMIRHSMATYNLMFYLNADERRNSDCHWDEVYGAVSAPIIRSLIDSLYNITAILENPREMGLKYHKSGFKRALADIREDEFTYAGKANWENFNQGRRQAVRGYMRLDNISDTDIAGSQVKWPTLGVYIATPPNTPHKQFLRKFTYLEFRQYSSLGHAAFEGYLGDMGSYFVLDALPHEKRPQLRANYPIIISKHLGRSALLLLTIVTEIQLYFRFKDADINRRIRNIWAALINLFEAKELYDERYSQLMKDRGITGDE